MATIAEENEITSILKNFSGNPLEAGPLAQFLGFDPVSSPQDLLSGSPSSGVRQFFNQDPSRFGVHQFFRVGRREAEPSEVGLFIGVLKDWGYRSSDRDRPRRRISRALVEHVRERRSLALLVPPDDDPRKEAELVFPRTPLQASEQSTSPTITSIRALLELDNPTRFHRDLLQGLRIGREANLLQVSRQWQQEFSVERVTTRFYQEYAAVRDRIVDAFLLRNKDHLSLKNLDNQTARKQARAWATRQMGRVLFLWFLQTKRWLGEPDGQGSSAYLLDLWDRKQGGYYSSLLEPLFFSALAEGRRGDDPTFGFIPYLNGGLFRRNSLEDSFKDEGDLFLPDEVFDPEDEHSLLGLLSRYRFTTRESTPDDQSVDPDPELLGRVFENLYQGDERHDTGTYFTPREIVHFMCREALDGYLRDTTGVGQDTLDALRETAFGSRDDQQQLDGVPVDRLVDALETVRVCDPAVGSGAFLLGTIQEMITLRRGILFSQRIHVEPGELYDTVSNWKRQIVENCLFGVDINPEAVEICRLRLWLSMVLDLDQPPHPQSGWALPNLDFQIVAGDSLVDRIAGITFKESWPPPKDLQLGMELQARLQRLEDLIDRRRVEFDRTHRNPSRLRELRDDIAGYQQEIIKLHLQDALEKANGELAALKKSSKPSKAALSRATRQVGRISALLAELEAKDFTLVQKPFLWPTTFPGVLRQGDANSGFDIVLANPPYVRMENLDNEDELAYQDAFPQVRSSRADVLVYFYSRALQILKPDGWLAFITSNKFMRADYGEGVRELLTSKLSIKRVVDFGDLPIFESNGKTVAAYPAVLVGHRSDSDVPPTSTVADLSTPVREQLSLAGQKANSDTVRSALENLDDLLVTNDIQGFPQILLRKNGWVLEDPALVGLFERLMNQGKPLGEYVRGRFYRGVVTGLNEAFVINQSKRDELVEEDPQSAELIRPWLRGRDIVRWKAESAGLYIIFTNRGVEIERYPAVLEHLKWFRNDLEKRATSHTHPWYELQQPQEGIYHEFALPKIIVNNVVKYPHFCYDESGSYINNACFFLIPPSPSVAAILNSRIGSALLYRQCTLLQNNYVQVFLQFIERIPIPELSRDAETRLTQLVKELSNSGPNPSYEDEIESIVAEAYGLDEQDQHLVGEWVNKRA